MARVFVTGANGFIGTHLVRALEARGDSVRQMVWKMNKRELPAPGEREDVVVASLDDVETMTGAMAGTEVVFHLAGRTSGRRIEEFMATNLEGAKQVVAAMRAAPDGPRRLIFVSSAMAAGPSLSDASMNEAHEMLQGVSMYGDSKYAAEHFLYGVAREGDISVSVIRPPIVYGPGDRDILTLIRSAKTGVVGQPGRKIEPFSIVYVEDLVAGMLLVEASGESLPTTRTPHVLEGSAVARAERVEDPADGRGMGIYYFTDGATHTGISFGKAAARALGKRAIVIRFPVFMVMLLARVLELVASIRGVLPALSVDRAHGAVRAWWCDDRRARQELGYAPQVDIDEGMRRTVEWAREAGRL